jgi:hypothetical protein
MIGRAAMEFGRPQNTPITTLQQKQITSARTKYSKRGLMTSNGQQKKRKAGRGAAAEETI